MRDVSDRKGSGVGGARRAAAAARLIPLLGAAGLLCVFVITRPAPASSAGAAPPAKLFVRAVPLPQEGAVTKFSHSIQKHSEVACDSCHRREDNSTRPRLPGHKACTDCHIQQFVTSGGPLCSNCHPNVEGSNPPLKSFPGLASFNMRFDHASHMAGGARPEQGCASCHRPARRGVALSIPAGATAHDNCYSCHTPGARGGGGGDISSCATCHAAGGYSRTPASSRAYAVSFSHAAHGARQGMRCDDCHQVRAGAGQGRQVTAPRPTQHFGSGRAQTCLTCHNNRRAFGGDDFADCKRCHQGPTFRF